MNARFDRIFVLIAIFGVSIPPSQTHADPASPTCEVAKPLEGQRLLRRISLDLRGTIPGYVDALEQRGLEDVPSSTVDRFLETPEFLDVMRRHHASLLWPNLDQVELLPQTHELIPIELTPGSPIYLSPLRAVFLRAGPGNLFLPCKDEPARFDADGMPIADPLMMGDTVVGWQEGWVEVEPYWAPGTTVKVCGFDAQTAERAVTCPGPESRYTFLEPTCVGVGEFADSTQTPFRGSETACDSALSLFAPGCGCGPNLRHCVTEETAKTVRAALLEQELRIVDRVITDDRPYEEVLRTKNVEVNGPVAHYLRFQAALGLDLYGAPDPTAPIPEGLTFTDADRWVETTRTGRHSGVLTTPGYLLRFASNRARAHRFYNAFECSSLIPAGPLPSPFEDCSKHEDLTKRCGCDACHQALEPMAAHWGRFAEYGLSPLDDENFPATIGPSCTAPFDDVEQLLRCVRFYEVEPVGEELPYFGNLHAYVFRSPDEVENIEEGPARLVGASIDSGRFATCTARRMWTHFMRRTPTAEEERDVLPSLVTTYESSGSSLRALVKAIVALPAYRRLP